jgi:hypothetical protein
VTPLRILLSCALLPAALASAAPSSAYEFVGILDSTGPYSFFTPPSINASGAVAFRADLDAGGTAIVYATASATTPIEDLAGPYAVFLGQVGIADDGTVLFAGELDAPTGGTAISSGDGVSTQLLFDRSGIFSTFGVPAIASSGAIAFQASLDSGLTGIFVDGMAIADDTGPIDDLLASMPAVNASGEVAYFAESSTVGTGIFRGPALPNDVVADTSGPYAGFGLDVSINDAGTVAFVASLDAGGNGVFIGANPATGTVANSGGAFAVFGTPSINGAGTVAFSASLDAGGGGLFTGPDPEEDRVVTVGDPLFGSTVAAVTFRSAGLNEAGDVAFSYQLTNGRRGIAVAVVPEPGAAAGCAAAGVALLGLRALGAARRAGAS